MFYLRYLRNELVRRRARTIVTLIGLGAGVALVIALSSLSKELDRVQQRTLDPPVASPCRRSPERPQPG